MPPELHRKVKDAVETVARSALTAMPIYRFEQRTTAEVTAEHLLETVAVREGRLVATMRLPL